jgi:addiction module HigA family antidote
MARKLKPVHPGEILREEFMAPLGLSMNKIAMALRVPVTRIADIVNERRGITADTPFLPPATPHAIASFNPSESA